MKQYQNYGNIINPYLHINSNYGDGWMIHSEYTILEFAPLDMVQFSAENHCSLTSLSAIFNYHRTQGYSSISSDIDTLFHRIKTIAKEKGYLTPRGKTLPWYIDNLATDIWQYYGYTGKGKNHFFFWDTDAIYHLLKKEIDANRPGSISFTSGYYQHHTVTYYGYVLYTKLGQPNKMYLKVNDHWTKSARYVDMTSIGELGQTFFEICEVCP